jgi:hypothetical protein
MAWDVDFADDWMEVALGSVPSDEDVVVGPPAISRTFPLRVPILGCAGLQILVGRCFGHA